METKPSNLAKKLSTIMSELSGSIYRTGKKSGTTRAGGQFEYDVLSEADVLAPCQRAFAAKGVAIIPEVLSLDHKDKFCDVLVKFSLIDAETGEVFVGQMAGSAEERGDGTGISKASTDACKSFLRKLLLLSASDDENKSRAQQSRPAPRPAQSTAAPATAGPALISEPQRKRLWALCKQHGVDADALKDYVFKVHNFASSRDISRAAYETVCMWIERGGK